MVWPGRHICRGRSWGLESPSRSTRPRSLRFWVLGLGSDPMSCWLWARSVTSQPSPCLMGLPEQRPKLPHRAERMPDTVFLKTNRKQRPVLLAEETR